MRNWLALILLVGVAVVSPTVQAQYPPGYYYPQPNGYWAPAPNYQRPQMQPMPRYVPAYPPNYQGMPTYVPRSQDTHVVISDLPTAAVHPLQRSNDMPNVVEPSVRPAEKAPVTTPISKTPVSDDAAMKPTVAVPARRPSLLPTVFKASDAKVVPISLPQAKEPPQQKLEPLPPPDVLSERGRRAHNCRLMVFGEYLYWNVHGVDVPFAQPFNGVDPVFSVPRGPVAMATPLYTAGFRAGAGASISDGKWVVGTFTSYNNRQTEAATAGAGLVLRPFLTFPNTANAAVDSLTATADYRFRLLSGDIDGKVTLIDNDVISLKALAGGRYAHIDQNLFATYQVTGTTRVDSTINFDGFGPRAGFEGEYRLRCGLHCYANGVFDVLFGQFRGNYEQRNVFTGLVGLTSINNNRVVPVLEFELGGGWQSSNGKFRVSGGYYVGSWFNMVTTNTFARAIGNVNFTTAGNNFRDTVVFDGFVFRGELRY